MQAGRTQRGTESRRPEDGVAPSDASLRVALAAVQRLELVLAQSPVPMATLSGPEHVFDSANAAYRRLAGDRALIGIPALDAWPALAGHGFLDLVEQVYGTGQAASANEVPLRASDGTVAHYNFLYQPLIGGSGELLGLLAVAYDVTAIVAARTRAERNAQRLQALAEATSHMIWMTDAQGVVVDVSPSWIAFTGQTPEEWMGWGWLDAVHPDDRRKAQAAWSAAVAAKGRYEVEYRVRHHSGEYRATVARGTPVLDEAGQLAGFIGSNEDVTARKELEGQLETERRLLRGVLDQMPSGLLVRDAKSGRTLLENESLRRIAGRGPQEGFDVFTLDGRKYAPEEFPLRRTLATGETVEAERVVYATPDGSRKYLALSSAPLRDANGAVAAGIGIVQDLTARFEAEHALRESDEILRMLVDNVPQMIWSGWADSPVGFYSRYTERYTGVPIERIKAKGFQVLIHPDDVAAVQGRWAVSKEQGTPFDVELRVRRHDGQYRWHVARALPVHVEGRPLRWFGSLTDIEDQKRQEEEASRLAELNQQLLGIVGHDLRDPISAVLFSAAQLRMGPLGDVQRKQATRISSSAERALRILETLLDFTRAKIGGGIPVTREPVDVGELCRELCDELRIAGGRTLELTLEGNLRASLDEVRLSQVVSNLVSNALQYGAPNATVAVSARGSEREIAISVHNEGSPIPEDAVPILFEAYKRRASPLERGRNLGLGLYIVRQIAHAHGGEVEVRSNATEGTTFTVRLPR